MWPSHIDEQLMDHLCKNNFSSPETSILKVPRRCLTACELPNSYLVLSIVTFLLIACDTDINKVIQVKLPKNTCCDLLLELPHPDSSNQGPNYAF